MYKVVHPNHVGIPQVLLDIQKEWARKANEFGDIGSCVLGAGFRFVFEGFNYRMPPASKWQGCCSWEAYRGDVRAALIKAGAKGIQYDWGSID